MDLAKGSTTTRASRHMAVSPYGLSWNGLTGYVLFNTLCGALREHEFDDHHTGHSDQSKVLSRCFVLASLSRVPLVWSK